MTYTKKTTLNQDVAGLAERVDEVIYEVLKSQSANQSDMKSFDRDRITAYNERLKRYATWVVDAPDVDLPETHPREYTITFISEEVVDEVENKAIKDLVRYYRALITELVNSQSSKAGNGLITHDKRRFDLVMTKIENFLSEFVDNTQPVDLPESSPSSDPVNHGYTG